MGRNVDLVMARLKSNDDVLEMAKYSPVPLINGCCNKCHPCQGMADIMTIFELFKTYNVKVLYIGARNNVFNSLLASLPRLGADFYAVTPIESAGAANPELVAEMIRTGKYHDIDHSINEKDFRHLAAEMDVIYTDTWVSMGQEDEKTKRIADFQGFAVDAKLLSQAPKAKIMHCLPAYRGLEITDEAVESPNSIIFDQSENRLHFQRALVKKLMS